MTPRLVTIQFSKAGKVASGRKAPTVDRLFLRIGLGMLSLGVFLLTGGTWLGLSRSNTEGLGVTEGVVVEVRSNLRGKSAPVADYEVDGKSFRHVSRVFSSFCPRVNETATITYSPDDPSKGRIHSFSNNWGLSAIMYFVGTIALFLGIVGTYQALGGKRRFQIRMIR